MNTHNLSASQKTEVGNIGTFNNTIDLLGRIGLAAIFFLAGLNKIQNYEGSAQYLASGGLPELLLPGAIVFEIVAAVFIIIGFQVRWTALAIAGFSVLTAVLYHANLGDQTQFIMFFKNIAIAGGFLVLAANGAARYSIDAKRGSK